MADFVLHYYEKAFSDIFIICAHETNEILVLLTCMSNSSIYSSFCYIYINWRGSNYYTKWKTIIVTCLFPLQNDKSRKENPQKLTQLSSRSHPRHLMGKRTAQKDTIIDITNDSQVNSNFPYRWSPASLTFNNYFTYFYIYI